MTGTSVIVKLSVDLIRRRVPRAGTYKWGVRWVLPVDEFSLNVQNGRLAIRPKKVDKINFLY